MINIVASTVVIRFRIDGVEAPKTFSAARAPPKILAVAAPRPL